MARRIIKRFGILAVLLIATFFALSPNPQRPASAAGATQVAAGGFHSCALLDSGGVRCWGANGFGELGDGTTTTRALPVDVTGLASGVTSISSGFGHTCAVVAGAAMCWGANGFGQLGNGTTINSNVPINVTGLGAGVVAVAAGDSHTCALLASGGVQCWGLGGSGQLGDGLSASRLTPVDVVGVSGAVDVLTGASFTCVLKASSDVLCWGSTGGPTPSQTFQNAAEIIGGSAAAAPCLVTTSATLSCLAGPTGVTGGAIGYGHSCISVGSGGAQCWGGNQFGELGNGGTTASATPVNVVGLTGTVADISAAGYHTCAALATGDVKCWGLGNSGQLGAGYAGSSPTALSVVGLKPGSCPPAGCEPPIPDAIPLPDCSAAPLTTGAVPGMSISGPSAVLQGDTFTICVQADPAPMVATAGFDSEVIVPPGLTWVQRPGCSGPSPLGDAVVTVGGGGLPGQCIRQAAAGGEARHVVGTAIAAPPLPAFDSPLGRLLELDVVCATPGSYELVLTAANVPNGSPFGAIYFATSTAEIVVSTIPHDGQNVADVHTVTCLSPSATQDSDDDGCKDVRELDLTAMRGGYRDPDNFGDFFDVPTGQGLTRNGSVSGPDIFGVLARFGAEGNPSTDPLAPPPAQGYHTAYDRGASVGPNGWNVAPADGSIAVTDVFTVISQFGHSCE